MKFLSINPNVSVRKEEIIAVERNEFGMARVILENSSYDTDFPYETILQVIEIPDIEESMKRTLQEPMTRDEAFHKPMQYFAG